jgi:hypothetical protein
MFLTDNQQTNPINLTIPQITVCKVTIF